MASGKGLLGLSGAKIYSIIERIFYACTDLKLVYRRRCHLWYLILGFYSVKEIVLYACSALEPMTSEKGSFGLSDAEIYSVRESVLYS